MKLVYKKGDLIEHLKSNERFDAYAHQCNCFCRMGRGIAPQLANAVPGLREADNATEAGNPYKLGKFTSADFVNTTVYNLYGQFHWKNFPVDDNRNTDYIALKDALTGLKYSMYVNDKKTLGLPKIGCGLAGGDWLIVSEIIEEVFEDTDIIITVFEL